MDTVFRRWRYLCEAEDERYLSESGQEKEIDLIPAPAGKNGSSKE